MRLGTIGNVWRTVKEIDVQAIREEAEQPLQIVLVGDDELRAPLARLLRDGMGTYRYPALGPDPLQELWLPLARERQGELSRADLLILVLSAQRPLRDDEYMAYEKLIMVDAPLLVVVSGGFQLPLASPGTPAPDWSGQRVVYLDRADGSLDRLSEAIVELLPDDRRLAAARRLAGLRPVLARMVVGEISRSNAMYALTSGIPQLVPILNIPLVAADMIVLTKNQALMVYRLALAMGAPADFTAQMQEIMPVIGGGFLWRQLARELVGLIPGFGLVPKVAVAYAGTYTVGVVAWRWYAQGEIVARSALRTLMRDALKEGRERAHELIERHRPEGGVLDSVRRFVPGPIRRLLPGKEQPATAEQEPVTEGEKRP